MATLFFNCFITTNNLLYQGSTGLFTSPNPEPRCKKIDGKLKINNSRSLVRFYKSTDRSRVNAMPNTWSVLKRTWFSFASNFFPPFARVLPGYTLAMRSFQTFTMYNASQDRRCPGVMHTKRHGRGGREHTSPQ